MFIAQTMMQIYCLQIIVVNILLWFRRALHIFHVQCSMFVLLLYYDGYDQRGIAVFSFFFFY